MLIKGFNEPENQNGLNENTLEWRGTKLKDLSKKSLIDIIVNLFRANLILQQKIKEQEQKNRIIYTPHS